MAKLKVNTNKIQKRERRGEVFFARGVKKKNIDFLNKFKKEMGYNTNAPLFDAIVDAIREDYEQRKKK